MKILYTFSIAVFFTACGVKPVGQPAKEFSALEDRFGLDGVGKTRASALYSGKLDVGLLSRILEDFKGAGWDVRFCSSDDIPLSSDYDVAPEKGDYFVSKSWPEDNGRISLLLKPEGKVYALYFYSN